MLSLVGLVLAGAVPLLPLVAKNWQRSGRPWLRALGRVLAPFALLAAFEVSLLGGGGIALMRFRLEGTLAAVCALGFLMLQPVGILLALRVAREGEAIRPVRMRE